MPHDEKGNDRKDFGDHPDSLLVACRAVEVAVTKEDGRFFPYKLYLKIVNFCKIIKQISISEVVQNSLVKLT